MVGTGVGRVLGAVVGVDDVGLVLGVDDGTRVGASVRVGLFVGTCVGATVTVGNEVGM